MLLKNLINQTSKRSNKLIIRGLAVNSKDVKKGYIFFAIKGNKSNGENYIQEAIKKGATVIICSDNCKFTSSEVIVVRLKKIRNYLSEVASKFYKLKPKNIIAITGTNGKTSVADYFNQILNINKISSASIGTLGIKLKKKNIKTNLTTPDSITLHKYLENFKKKKINNVIIEASSHGLHQNRLDHINFKAGIFTNFSQDHLDYHKNMKKYLEAKLILFKKLLKIKKFIISDRGMEQYKVLEKISKNKKLKLLDISKKNYQIKNIPPLLSSLFQKKNLLMAIYAAKLCGLNDVKINNSLKKIKNVSGRLELIREYPNNIKLFIDFAHTPDALSEVINSVKNIYNNNISLVFGCGGDRDFKKRPIMAKIAKLHCKKIYVTDDNPRNENPTKIRKEIIKNLNGSNYFNIGNREDAIREAVMNAEPNEIILITGKGHENFQDYGNKIINVSDKKIVKNLKISKEHFSQKKQNYLFNQKILSQIVKTKKFKKFNGLAIDSRDVKKDNLFLTIKGKNKDGSQFISEALAKGASNVISSKKKGKYRNKIIKVSNEINFLKKFACLKREKCNAKVIAITGSAGKTSLKNLLDNLLSKFGRTYSSPRSFNNHFGVPISLSNLNIDHQYGVFEVGMSKKREIHQLTKMIKPNLGIITNIGEAHIENFRSIFDIAKAKSEIINNIQRNGTIILNRDDKFFNFLNKKSKLKNLKIVTFGKNQNSNIKLIKIKKINNLSQITVMDGKRLFRLRVNNINIYNILCSLAVLKELGLNINKIIDIYKTFEPSEGRGKLHIIKRYKKKFKLIDESYNANPLSVKNAINSFSAIKKKSFKKYLLLGDMLELGKKSEMYHKNVSKLINNSDIDKVFIKGQKSLFTYKNLIKHKRGNIFQCNQDVDLTLENIITNNDYLMIKGSNATGLNNISKEMIKES